MIQSLRDPRDGYVFMACTCDGGLRCLLYIGVDVTCVRELPDLARVAGWDFDEAKQFCPEHRPAKIGEWPRSI